MNEHRVLLAISVDFLQGMPLLKKIFSSLQAHCELLATSSIYKRYSTPQRDDLNAQLWVVVKISTDLSADALLEETSLIEAQLMQSLHRRKAKIILMAYEDQVLMSPRLTLPYVKLHDSSLFLSCAAEIWGSYVHPVLNKTLNELSKGQAPDPMLEFLAQGKTLLDF